MPTDPESIHIVRVREALFNKLPNTNVFALREHPALTELPSLAQCGSGRSKALAIELDWRLSAHGACTCSPNEANFDICLHESIGRDE